MTYEDFSMLFFLFKRFLLILLVAAVIAGITYLCYDSIFGTTDEMNKIENYNTLVKDEVRYILATATPPVQQMITDYPEDYHHLSSQMDSMLMTYPTHQSRHRKSLVTLTKSKDREVQQLSKCLLQNYRKTKIDLSPFEEVGKESIREFDRLSIKMTTFNNFNYKSSNVVYRFMEKNSGVHFKLEIGFICTCEADSADLARYSQSLL